MSAAKEYKIFLLGFRIPKDTEELKTLARALCNIYGIELVNVIEEEISELYETKGFFGKPKTKTSAIYRYYILCKGSSTHILAMKDGVKALRIGYNFKRQ